MGTKLSEHLRATAILYNRELTPFAAELFLEDLSVFPEDAVIAALSKCRKDLKGFPTVADIISRIDDGRPGAEEAWAMLPKSENESVVWSDEMSEAFGIVRALIEDDPIAARMAFREVYTKCVNEARNKSIKPKWSVSLGLSDANSESVLLEAARKGRISISQAVSLRPALESRLVNNPALKSQTPFGVSLLVDGSLKSLPGSESDK